MTLAAVMLGSAAVSAGCCLAPGADASRSARVLACAMVAVMTAATLDAAAALQGVGALLLLVLAGFVRSGPTERGTQADWHRASGAVLMALAVLLPALGGTMTTDQRAIRPAMEHGAAVAQGPVLLLRVATAAYLCW